MEIVSVIQKRSPLTLVGGHLCPDDTEGDMAGCQWELIEGQRPETWGQPLWCGVHVALRSPQQT